MAVVSCAASPPPPSSSLAAVRAGGGEGPRPTERRGPRSVITKYDRTTKRWWARYSTNAIGIREEESNASETASRLNAWTNATQRQRKQALREGLSDGQFVVDRILAYKQTARSTLYLIQWEGYDRLTWEPSSNLRGGNLEMERRKAPPWNEMPADVQREFLKRINGESAVDASPSSKPEPDAPRTQEEDPNEEEDPTSPPTIDSIPANKCKRRAAEIVGD
ncbi:hypothetical protein NFJ02_07g134170 [Pycnococcus provasolii]